MISGWPSSVAGTGTSIEVETVEQFDRLVASGATSMAGWRLQDLDLRDRSEALRGLDAAGALFLGGSYAAGDEDRLRAGGALLFPEPPGMPVDAYRSALYTPAELYDGLGNGYERTYDARVYAWSREVDDLAHTLGQALHDHAIDDALDDVVTGRRRVGVMGGHAARRGTPAYADAARLGRALAVRGVMVCTGGGPGAMEAANLGARAAAS